MNYQNRKGIIIVLVTILALSLFNGCGKKTTENGKNEGNVNTTYKEGMDLISVSGDKIKGNDNQLVPYPGYGFAQFFPKSWGTFEDLNMVALEKGICITFLPPSLMPDVENMTEEEINAFDFESALSKQINLIKTFYDSADVSISEIEKEHEAYQKVKKLATLDGNTYYVAYNDSLSLEQYPELTQEDLDKFDSYAKALPDFCNNIMVFPIQKSEIENGITSDQIRSLEGKDLNGNAVDSTIFSNYDLTMVNIWATWCGPCVEELPALANLHKNLPKNVNLITICSDGSEAKSNAKSILNESGAKFVTVCGDKTIQETVLKNITSYPTTIFVDRNGDIIGQPVLGAVSEDDYTQEINTRLESISN